MNLYIGFHVGSTTALDQKTNEFTTPGGDRCEQAKGPEHVKPGTDRRNHRKDPLKPATERRGQNNSTAKETDI